MAAQGTSSATSGPGPSPLSAEDIVALATSLLPSLLLLQPPGIPDHLLDGCILKEDMEWVAGWVRATRPDLKELADACTHGVALALLSLSAASTGRVTRRDLNVRVTMLDARFVSEEAVAAFYATLHSKSVVEKLTIEGAAFSTPAAAAHLGRCLNLNSSLRELEIHVDAFGGEAAWTALSEALTSNATIQNLKLVYASCVGMSGHMSPKFAEASAKLSALRILSLHLYDGERATLGDLEGWGQMLAHERCPLTELHLWLPLGGGLAAIYEGMLTNTTLQKLSIWEHFWGRDDEASVMIEDTNAEALAAMLRTNSTLKTLDMSRSRILWNATVVYQGLSCNSSLEELAISLDSDGPYPLLTLLQQPPGGTSPTTKTVTTAVSSKCPAQLRKLKLGKFFYGEGFPTATALGDMLASNRTLLELDLSYAPYSKEEWATTILPALANNQSLQRLELTRCEGLDGELVYDALLELLESNTCIQHIDLNITPLWREGKAAAVDEELQANKEYRAALKDVPTTLTNSCRLVLCGSPYAGKTTLLETMMRLQHHDGCGQMMKKKKLATSKWPWLLKHDDKLELSRRTRGIDIHPVQIQDLTLWMWDFAGQTEFHSLQDFIFPNGSTVHAATAFVFIFNPILDDNSSNKRGGGQGIKSKHQFKQEFSYWLRFICSNAKPRPSRASKPLVLVVITHKDSLTRRTKQDVEMATKEWVRDMASMFEHLVTLEASNLFFVDATDQDDSELTSFVAHTVNSLRTRISNVAKVPTICDAVATALGQGGSGQQQQLEPIISIQDFQSLCKSAAEELSLQQLVSNTSAADKLPKAVAAYLRDAGEVLYFPDLPFIVRNPRWFAHGILGYLVNIFSDHDYDDAPSTSCCVTKRQVHRMRKQDAFQNGLVSKDSLSELLETALNELGLNPNGVNMDQLIQLMEELDLCYPTGHDSKYLVPAVFEDEGDKAANGERQRSWKASSSRRIFVTRRLECSDPIRTFVTPGFFPRLQVVLHNKTGEWAKDKNPDNCTLDKNLCHLHFNGMEILVEHSGSSGYSVDIMVQSCQPRKETVEFVESQIISSIRRLCASRKGCQGVTLAEAIIRPDCVGAGKITLCRYRQSILVDDLKQLMASIPNYMHSWNAVMGEDGNVILHSADHHPKLLLDGEGQGEAGEGQGEAGPVAGIQEADFVSDMPKLILVTWQDVNWARDMAAKAAKMLKAWKAESFRLHLQCECREGPHDVTEQPGRTFYVADQRFVMVHCAGAQAAGVVAAGLQVGGLFVPGLAVAGGVASGLGQSYKPTPIFPFDIETLSQRITSARPRNVKVPPEALREEVEKDLRSSIEGSWLRAFLNPDAQAFRTDFRLIKVQYITSPLAGFTAWLCDRHWTEGRDQRSLRGV